MVEMLFLKIEAQFSIIANIIQAVQLVNFTSKISLVGLTFVMIVLMYDCEMIGNMDRLKETALCQFDYVNACLRACGIFQLLSIYEECAMQVLHHDIQVFNTIQNKRKK